MFTESSKNSRIDSVWLARFGQRYYCFIHKAPLASIDTKILERESVRYWYLSEE